MGCSTNLKANEARMFWTAVSEMRRAQRENVHILVEHHDELEVIQQYTESPLLKKRIGDVLGAPDTEGQCGSLA